MKRRRELLVTTLVVLAALLASLLLFVSQGFWNQQTNDAPDTIIHNGEIITMEQSPAQVQALAIRGESILAIGDESDILAMGGPSTHFIDLGGRTLLPGFIDSHSHHIGDRNYVNQSTPEEAIESVLSSGWTSISELFVNQDRLDELRTLDEEENLRIRVNAYLPLSWQFERFGDWYEAYQPGQEFSSKLRIAGVKIFMDSWFTDWLHYFDQIELESLVQEAHDAGYQIAIHSVVENATDIVLDTLEAVLGGESNQLYRHRIEHLVLLRDDQIDRMGSLGIIASFQLPWFNSDWIEAQSFPYLQDYSHLAGRWRDIVQAGIPSLGSTDFPWNLGEVRSAMRTLSMAVTRIGLQELTPLDWMLNQTLSVEQALRIMTIDAAYGTFQEDVKGSIRVGKLADFVVLSDNPLTVPESSLANIEVLMTIVGGVAEYTAPGQQFLSTVYVGASSQTVVGSGQIIKMEMVDRTRFELATTWTG
ncbi:MAG: amidohydrolase family protein [Candidatus Thorarchaeota archaeon]|nr:MAG: amidohydrolase family protein [Candidatus Thorarchaeota archaeon]